MTDNRAVQVHVDASKWLGELPHNWNYIGYDEPNYTYAPEGEALLAKFGALQEKPYYVRPHHVFCTGNTHHAYKWGSTNVYLEDEEGNPIYDFETFDLIFDTLLKHNLKPFVELGFMPRDLVDPKFYNRDTDGWTMQEYKRVGWACPPKDYQKWHDLVYNIVRHFVERHGEAEVLTWYFELWNEPDIFYWQGSKEEFNKLYDYTVAAVKSALPGARVGGPATTDPAIGKNSGDWLDAFLDHCHNGTNYVTGETGTEVDFTTFHVKGGGYRSNPLKRKQDPPSIKKMMKNISDGREIIKRYPRFTDLECILSEIDPDGWAAGGAFDNINLNFRNTEYYASFVATIYDKATRYAQDENWDLRFLAWAFMFVAERMFEGTRSFSTQGVDKAVLNLFRLYAKMGNTQIAFGSSGAKNPLLYADMFGRDEESDISGFAALSGSNSAQILIYHHHDDWDRTECATIDLVLNGLPFGGDAVVHHWRIDKDHSNAYAEWVRQDKPIYPQPGQYAAIKARDGLELLEPPSAQVIENGALALQFDLPVHGISLITVEAR